MNEFLNDAKSVILALLGIIVSLLGWHSRRQVARIDALEANYVTREELKETLKQMREDRQRMHDENREDLHYIRQRLDDMS